MPGFFRRMGDNVAHIHKIINITNKNKLIQQTTDARKISNKSKHTTIEIQ